MHLPFFLLLAICISISICISAQQDKEQQKDSTSSTLITLDYLDKVTSRADHFKKRIDQRSDKALQRLRKIEKKLESKLAKKDSLKAREIFGNAKQQYDQLEQKFQQGLLGKLYIAPLDTLGTSLKFLQQHSQFLPAAKNAEGKLKEAIGKVNALKDEFQKAEQIKIFLKERRQYLKDQLSKIGLAKGLKKLNKEVYYYSAQISEYKELLHDHSKAEKTAVALLCKTKVFKDFMRKNSQLASLFRLPGSTDDQPMRMNLDGLQTRVQVNNLIQQQFAAGGANAQEQFRQNLREAHGYLDQLKNKITQFGGSTNIEMPDGFKPNNQKTKSFFKRLEFGTNIQSQKGRGFFPTTSDIGLSVGYKLNDKSIIGIGASYKIGFGTDIRHIRVSHQGLGLRSFTDWKIRGSFWLTGGYEMNYKSEFKSIEALKNLSAWQQSGLIGLSKTISLKTKFFKKTSIQILWDLLSYQQVPKTQPLLFRIGYKF